MTISTIRKFTADDAARIEKAAARFCSNHGITVFDGGESAEAEIEAAIRGEDDRFGTKDIFHAWQRCCCRALREPYDSRLTVAYGYVGLYID